MTEEVLVDMWSRPFGHAQVQTRQVPKSKVPEFRKKGWVGPGEAIPDPEPPDLEVLEIILKDRHVEHEKAKELERGMQGRVHDAANAVNAAKTAISAEPGIRAQLAETAQIADIQKRAWDVLNKAGNSPIPLSMLLSLAGSDVQSRYIRETFSRESHSAGLNEAGDRLVVRDRVPYLIAKEREATEAAAAKEAAVRARMPKGEGH